jgi:hypothetical protein
MENMAQWLQDIGCLRTQGTADRKQKGCPGNQTKQDNKKLKIGD